MKMKMKMHIFHRRARSRRARDVYAWVQKEPPRGGAKRRYRVVLFRVWTKEDCDEDGFRWCRKEETIVDTAIAF